MNLSTNQIACELYRKSSTDLFGKNVVKCRNVQNVHSVQIALACVSVDCSRIAYLDIILRAQRSVRPKSN